MVFLRVYTLSPGRWLFSDVLYFYRNAKASFLSWEQDSRSIWTQAPLARARQSTQVGVTDWELHGALQVKLSVMDLPCTKLWQTLEAIQMEIILCFRVQCRCLQAHNGTTKSSVFYVRQLYMCFREAPAEDPAEPEDAGGRVAPVAAGLAAVERLQRAAQQEDSGASQGQPSPPKKPFRTPSVPSLCALATRATVHLMTGERPRWVRPRFSENVSRCFIHRLWSFLALPHRSAQYAVQQQSGRPDPRAGRASAQPHVPWEAATSAYVGAFLRLPVAEVCPQLLPILHQWTPAAVKGLHSTKASESGELASHHWYVSSFYPV